MGLETGNLDLDLEVKLTWKLIVSFLLYNIIVSFLLNATTFEYFGILASTVFFGIIQMSQTSLKIGDLDLQSQISLKMSKIFVFTFKNWGGACIRQNTVNVLIGVVMYLARAAKLFLGIHRITGAREFPTADSMTIH